MHNNFQQAEQQQLLKERLMMQELLNIKHQGEMMAQQNKKCPYCEITCNKEHFLNCKHRPLPCEFCGVSFPISLMPEHLEHCEVKKQHSTIIKNVQNPRPQTQNVNRIQNPQQQMENHLQTLRQQYDESQRNKKQEDNKFIQIIQRTLGNQLDQQLDMLRNSQRNIQAMPHQLRPPTRVAQQVNNIEQRESIFKAQQNQVHNKYDYKIKNQDKQEKILEIVFKKSRNLSPSAQNCVICQEDFNEQEKILLTECFHRYHQKCLRDWLKKMKNCPICKTTL